MMAKWVTLHTRSDGKRRQEKRIGNAWASAYESGYDDRGWSYWYVYVGDGNNVLASGATRTFRGTKIAASRALKKAVQ